MNSIQRTLKQLTIVLIIVAIIAFVIYIMTRPKTDPCFNGIKDGYETGIDCGGLCDKACPIAAKPDSVKDVTVNWVKFVQNGDAGYDLVADISNENKSWGVANMDYEFTYYDDAGSVIGKRQGSTFVMPKGDTSIASVKYIIEKGISTSEKIGKVDIALSNKRWEEVKGDTDIKNLSENIIAISNKNFAVNDLNKVYTASGTTKNTSKYDFYKVDINIVVLGKGGDLLAATRTNQLTMGAGNGWGFEVPFPNLTVNENEIGKTDMEAETDVFDKNNFMKEYRSDQ